jgi:hypothetical protein
MGSYLMSKPIENVLQSILDDFAASRQEQAELEAKALFRLLNCCLPSAANTREASLEEVAQRV